MKPFLRAMKIVCRISIPNVDMMATNVLLVIPVEEMDPVNYILI